jgi:hypothetical protein
MKTAAAFNMLNRLKRVVFGTTRKNIIFTLLCKNVAGFKLRPVANVLHTRNDMKKLITITLLLGASPAHACGGLLRDLIDPNCHPPPPMSWFKAGAGTAEFAQTRYGCLKESQQPSGTALVLGPNGGAVSGVVNDYTFRRLHEREGLGLAPLAMTGEKKP